MIDGHVLTVASGFGLRIIPARGPLRFRRAGSSRALDLECHHASGWRFARITPDGGEFISQLGEDTATLAEVATVEVGPTWEAWWIETTRYRVPLPAAWTVYSSGSRDEPTLFDLLGPPDCAIFVRTPRRMPSLEALLGPGQRFRDTGQLNRAAWIEFDYTHDDRAWLQRHELFHRGMTPFVVTLQAPADEAGACISTLASIVEQLQPPTS
jgi:hypothetical protein